MKKVIIAFVLINIFSYSAADNLNVKSLYHLELQSEAWDYDVHYEENTNELIIIYSNYTGSDESIQMKKLKYKNNKFEIEDSSLDSYNYSKVNYLNRFFFNIDLFNNFGTFFFTEVDLNDDDYKELVLINYVPSPGIRFFEMEFWKKGTPVYEEYKDWREKIAIHVLIQDGKMKKHAKYTDILIDSNGEDIFKSGANFNSDTIKSPYGILPFNYKNSTLFLVFFACEGGVSGWNYFFRIYDNTFKPLYQSTREFELTFLDHIVNPLIIDVDDDGNDEIILFSTWAGGDLAGFYILKIEESKDS